MSGIKLAGNTAIVTGGSRGIGRGIALSLAAAGADVAFCHYGDDERAKATVADIEALGARATRLSVMSHHQLQSKNSMQTR